ncbi:MAG: carbohydrate ABC transporter permease [Caldilineaceae bacterium]|nr:carbohydrate ABC transporter permease [Caldilineaceae bacterium]
MAQTFPYRPVRPVAALREVLSNSYRLRYVAGRVVLYAVLIAGAILVSIPFIWLISSSLKPQAQLVAFPPIWIPKPILWENYPKALTALPFGRFILNTVIIATGATLGSLVSSSLGAFAFSRLRWRFRDAVFFALLLTIMLPGQITMIPRFVLFSKLGWVNTYLPLIVPAWFASPFYVFLMRQFFMGLPSELDDAARIDGASVFGIYWRIMLPLSKPVLATVALFSIQHHWNAFIGPLIYLHDLDKFTAAIGLRYFVTDTQVHYNLQMAASATFTIPIIVMFFFGQRYFIQGIVFSGVKG